MNGHTSCPGCELELRTAAARCPRCGRWLGPVNRRFVVAVLVVVVLLLGAFVGLMRQQWIAQRASGMRAAEEAAQRQELERQRAQAQRAAERAGAERTAERVPPPIARRCAGDCVRYRSRSWWMRCSTSWSRMRCGESSSAPASKGSPGPVQSCLMRVVGAESSRS